MAALLGPQGTQGAIVVGYSYGGPIALRLAVDYPDRVAGMLLIGSAADPKAESVHPFQHLAALWPLARLLPTRIHNSNIELIALRDELEELEPHLPSIGTPVTIVQGTHDTLVPRGNADYLQTHLTGCANLRNILVEDGDHYLPWTHVELVRQALDMCRSR